MIDSFAALMPFCFVSLMLLVGVILRRYVPVFQTFLVPASIIGGLCGLAILNFFDVGLNHSMFTMLTFQFFNLSFISLGLTGVSGEKNTSKVVIRGTMWMFFMTTALLCGQAALGYGMWNIVDVITGVEDFHAYGFLMAHGFTQGPGQALAVGSIWQDSFQIPDALPIALTFSAIGFLIASFVGVPIAKWGLRKGYSTYPSKAAEKDFLEGVVPQEKQGPCGRDTMNSGNVDTFSLHLALIGVSYMLTYCFCHILYYFLKDTVVAPNIFGLFFVWGMFISMFVQKIVSKSPLRHWVDSNVQRHFTGIFVDFLVTGTLLSISVAVVMQYSIHLLVVSFAGALFTLGMSIYFGRRINEYGLERLLVIFGSGTGTIPSGLALTRIVDNNLQTSAAFEAGAQQVLLSVVCFLVMSMTSTFPALGWSAWTIAGIDLAVFVACLVCLKVFGLWGKRQF